jgi:DMSO/TMAO reductase YedYZ molybdopterin-dependent catalytic subunit
MWVVALVLFWPVLAENLLGFPVGTSRTITILGILGIFALYAAVLALVYAALVARGGWRGAFASASRPRVRDAAPRAGQAGQEFEQGARAERTGQIDRRTLLVRSGMVSVGALVLGGAAINALLQALNGRSNLAYEGMGTYGPMTYLTPTSQFYVVSKNVIDPEVVASNWSLEVRGLVAQARFYDLAGLRALPQTERAITLECIANGVDGHLISNANWRGVALADLLHASGGAAAGASQVVFTSADGYVASLPLADLLAARTLLAWDMNGAALSNHHGFPLRAVVPGRFGEQSAKWVTRIELVDHPVKGFYQQQGWYSGPLYTISRIDNPGKNARLPLGQTVQMHGIAFGGTRGVQRVEVSTDGGATWNQANFPPPASSDTWVLWSWNWTPTAAGSYTLVVRATDGTGAPQITKQQGTVPNGGTGLQRIMVTVA